MNESVSTSSMFTCVEDVGSQMMYNGSDCSGMGMPVTSFFTFVCSGVECDYGVKKEYIEGENGGCSDDFEEVAVFTDRCISIPFEGSSEVTCSYSSGTNTNYTSSDCTGLSDTSSTDDDDCASIIVCSTDTPAPIVDVTPAPTFEDSSSAQTLATLIALAVSAITVLA